LTLSAAIRIARTSAVVLLAAWLVGTSVVAASHDHDSARLGARAADCPREPGSTSGACLVCRVFSENLVVQVAPVADRVPGTPPILQSTSVAPPFRAFSRSATRPRSPPRLPLEA